jgi:alpha-D-xyloside xylohydrolase
MWVGVLTKSTYQHWGGDPESTWEAIAETLRGGLSLTLSGFAFASRDIGGFEVRTKPLLVSHAI